MQQQPRRLWRKIGLQKNFLQGTSHSDQSKNTQFQESFIKSHLSQQQDIQNNSFLKMKNQLNKGQIGTDQIQNKSKQSNQVIESEQNCQTPIEILLTDSGIQRKYALWESDDKITTSKVNLNKQNNIVNTNRQDKQMNSNLLHGHARYNSVGSYINIDESHFSDVIESYGRKDTLENINNQINCQYDGQKQQRQVRDQSEDGDLSQRREITYQSYPLTGSKEQQIIKIRLMKFSDNNNQNKNENKNKNKNKNYLKQENKINQHEKDRFKTNSAIELQFVSKQQRVTKLQQKLCTIKKFIIKNLQYQHKNIKQTHNIFKQQLIHSLQQYNLYIKTTIQQQFQQHFTQLNDQIAYLYKQNQQLMVKIQDKQLLNKRYNDQNIQLKNTLSQIEQRKQLQIKNNKETITKLQNHINSLQEKLQDVQDLQNVQLQKQTLLSKIRTFSIQIETLQEQTKRLQTQNKTFQIQLNQTKVNQSLLTDKIKQLSVELTTKQLKIQQLQWQLTQLKSKELKIHQLQVQITQLNKQNQLIQSNIRSQFIAIIQNKQKQYLLTINKMQNQKSQYQQLISHYERQKCQNEKQLTDFKKERLTFDELKRQMSRMKEQTKDIVEMGQLLQTLLSESLRYNSIQVVTSIQKEYNVKEYDTLFMMFAFIKEEIHHNNNNNNNNNSKNVCQNIIGNQKYAQQSPNQSTYKEQNKNPLNNSPRTLNNESSTNLLRKTGYFGQPQSHQLSLNITLHDIQKNYSTQIPEQSQIQHYQLENQSKTVKMEQMRQFEKNRRVGSFAEQMNINKNMQNFDTDRVRFIDLRRQQSLKSMQNLNKRTINPDEKNNNYLKERNTGKSREKVNPTHIRNQSVNYHQQKRNSFNLNAQIKQDLQIVKSAFQSSMSSNDNQIQDVEGQQSSYLRRDKYNKNILQERNKYYDQQKHQQLSIANSNYSFSEYNSNQTNNLRHNKNIFGDQSFLNDDDDQYDTQSVITSYKSRDYQTNRDYKNTTNNNNNINPYTNKYPTQTERRYNNYEQQDKNTSLTKSRLQTQRQNFPNKSITQYGHPTEKNKTQRQDIIQKIKQRVKNKLRTSHSKHQPTYQTQQTPLIPSQPPYHVTPLTRSTYKKDYLHQNITKPSLISDRKDQHIPGSNNNNILAQFYQRHRNITPTSTYNSLTLNQRNTPLTINERTKSPSYHSASRSPSNTRSRSPSNASSVASKLTNKYHTGIGYTTGLSTNKNLPVGSTTPRSTFSRSLIQKPQFGAYSRKAGQIGENNLGPTYQPKGISHKITSRETNTGSYVKKY